MSACLPCPSIGMTAPRSPPAVGRFFPAAPKLGRRSKCRVMETVAALGCMTVTSSPAFGFLSGALFLSTDGTTALVSVFYQQVGAALAFFTTTPTARSLSLGARIRSRHPVSLPGAGCFASGCIGRVVPMQELTVTAGMCPSFVGAVCSSSSQCQSRTSSPDLSSSQGEKRKGPQG